MQNYYYFTFTQYDTFIQYMKHQKIQVTEKWTI